MGSQWSSQSANTELSTATSADSVPDPNLHNRKRQRSESTSTTNTGLEVSLDSNHNTSSSPQKSLIRERKRRRTSSVPLALSYLWETVNHTTARLFAKYGFLSFLELATAKCNAGELVREVEIRNAILTMLDYFQKEDVEILRRGWRALCIVCGCSQRPGQLPAREDPLEEDAVLVTMVMEHCGDNEFIQLLGCRALRVLVCGGNEKKATEISDENWTALHRAGVMRALVNAIRTNREERTIQGLCVSFIAMMIKEVGGPAREELVRVRGVQTLMQACRKWSMDEGVLHTLLCTIYQLTTQSTRQALIDNGAIPFLSNCILPHLDHKSVIELILGTLNQLCTITEQGLAGNAIIPKLLLLLEVYDDNETVQFFGMVLLRAAGRNERVPLEPALNRAVAAMRGFPSSGGILFFSCAVLWQLLHIHDNGQDEALELITISGGLELVATAVQEHTDVYGLAPVSHLILLYAWENRQRDKEEATLAFGGCEGIVSLITGLDDDDILPNRGNDNDAM